jgi:hypothetical protein
MYENCGDGKGVDSLLSLYSAFSPIFGVKFCRYLVVTQSGICGYSSGIQVSLERERVGRQVDGSFSKEAIK